MRSTPLPDTLRGWLPVVVGGGAALVVLAGCKPKELEHPRDEKTLLARSAISADADRLIDALVNNKVRELHAWMTPTLQGQLRLADLSATNQRLRDGYGTPLGILEERTHTARASCAGTRGWWCTRTASRGARTGCIQRLVLYQFALKGDRLDRLLVREHLDVKALKNPARRYTMVTRPHFVSTGEWTVSHGGKRRMTNYHHGSRGQRYAYDIVVQKGGALARGQRQQGGYCYGLPFLAPAPGTVVRAINDVPTTAPGCGHGRRQRGGDRPRLRRVLGELAHDPRDGGGEGGRQGGARAGAGQGRQLGAQQRPAHPLPILERQHGRLVAADRAAGAVRRRVRRRDLVPAQDAGARRTGAAQQAGEGREEGARGGADRRGDVAPCPLQGLGAGFDNWARGWAFS
jgi:hypothetical protein